LGKHKHSDGETEETTSHLLEKLEISAAAEGNYQEASDYNCYLLTEIRTMFKDSFGSPFWIPSRQSYVSNYLPVCQRIIQVIQVIHEYS
jgi:hypothetical protein